MQVKQFFQYTIILIQLCLCQLVYAQGISGVIYDEYTGESVPFATIYIDGSFLGISADVNGVFNWTNTDYPDIPLTVSAIGYFSKSINLLESNTKVSLKPKIYDIEEALVKSESLVKKRKKYLRIFKNEFLGTTDNARSCIILNEDDISFDYFCKDTIKAYVSKPLLIHNRALAYRLSYFIDVFEYCKSNTNTFFKGSMHFTKDEALLDRFKKYDDVRAYAYEGSRMHFFRSLWEDELKREGFKVLNTNQEAIDYKECIVVDERMNKYLKYENDIRIEHYDEVSIGTPLKTMIYFDQSGFYDPSAIIWKGAMSEQRVGDWLPYEYGTELD